MKVVCISDTHLRHSFHIPQGDLLIHAGDLTFEGDIQQLNQAAVWWNSLPFARKIIVPGNHDKLFDENSRLASSFFWNTDILIDKFIVIKGISIYGTPYQVKYNNWAFNKSTEYLTYCYAKIPSDLDILITHAPAYGTLDFSPFEKIAVGSKELAAELLIKKPRFHVCGHIHSSHGIIVGESTTSINAAICNEKYEPTYDPIVFEI